MLRQVKGTKLNSSSGAKINPRCILFDLDGTLIDTVDLIYQSFKYAVQKVLGLNLPKQQLLQNMGRPLKEQMLAISPSAAEELLKVYNAHNEALHDQLVKAYPGTEAVVKELKKQGYLIGVVTSKRRALSERGLKITGLNKYVDVLVAMEDTVKHKPDPEPVQETLKRLNCHGTALFVGDSPFDLIAGQKAGVLVGAALWGPFSKRKLLELKPDLVLTKLADIFYYL